MSKKQVGIIRNNGDVHTAQIGFHIGRVGVYVYAVSIGNIIVGNLGYPLMQ